MKTWRRADHARKFRRRSTGFSCFFKVKKDNTVDTLPGRRWKNGRMAITRTVETDVYCDICGEWVIGWQSNGIGISRAWAAHFARKKGCTAGEKIICKKCRIKKRIETCSIQRRIGSAGRDANGACMGFGTEASDEPIEKCKRCIACTSYQWEE